MDYDVVIAGGGVMGSSTAYHLLRSDPGLAVAVIEKDSSYERASTVLSDGNVRIQFPACPRQDRPERDRKRLRNKLWSLVPRDASATT